MLLPKRVPLFEMNESNAMPKTHATCQYNEHIMGKNSKLKDLLTNDQGSTFDNKNSSVVVFCFHRLCNLIRYFRSEDISHLEESYIKVER